MRRAILVLAGTLAVAHGADYRRDILPLWEKYCFGCHLTGVKMGSFELGTYEELMRPGPNGQVVKPFHSADSRLYQMVAGKIMPAMPMDGRIMPVSEVALVRQWIEEGAPGPEPSVQEKSTPRIGGRVYSMVLTPAGKAVLGGYMTIRVVDPRSNSVEKTFTGPSDAVRALAVSGSVLVAAGGKPGLKGEIHIWNLETGQPGPTLSGHSDCIYAAALSGDGTMLATASYDKLIKLWDTATGKEIRTLKDHIDAIYTLAFTPDGQRLISGAADRTVKVWNPLTGERLYTLGEPTDGIQTLVLSPDGERLAAAGFDKNIRIWQLGEKAGTLQNTLMAHEDAILKLAWSPDGALLASSSADKSIKVFSAATLTELKVLPAQPDWVFGLAFTNDSKGLIASRFDGSLNLYATEGFRHAIPNVRAAH